MAPARSERQMPTGDEPLVPLLDDLARARREAGGGGCRGAGVLEGEGAGEARGLDDAQRLGEVGLGLGREADDDVGGDRGVRDLVADSGQDREEPLAAVAAAHGSRPSEPLCSGMCSDGQTVGVSASR
jgi:hypothetical protein